MNKYFVPGTNDVGNSGVVVLENRYELAGVTYELSSCERLPPQKVWGYHDKHRLTLALSPLPKYWQCQFLNDPKPVPIGMLNFLPAGALYRMTARGGRHRWLNMMMKTDYFTKKSGQDDDFKLVPRTSIQGTPIDGALFRIAREIVAPSFRSRDLIKALTENVVIDLARYLMGPRRDDVAAQEGLSPQQLMRIKQYIENSDCELPKIDDLAQLLGVSRRHLTRAFKASMGQTIHDYIAEFRLRRAIEFLTRSELSVKEISHKLGFSSPWGLTAAFRVSTGQTPTQFRRQNRAS